MDNAVVYWDQLWNTYDAATQAVWNDAAAMAFAGRALCGCLDTIIDGQTLHRSENMFRSMLGLGVIDEPASAGVPAEQAIAAVSIYPDTSFPSGLAMQFNASDTIVPCWVVFNLNSGLKNPLEYFPEDTSTHIVDSGDPTPQAILAAGPPSQLSWCSFDTQGSFGFAEVCPFIDGR